MVSCNSAGKVVRNLEGDGLIQGATRSIAGAGHRGSSGTVPRIIVAVAPVAHVGVYLPEESRNPVTAEDIAEEVVRCVDAGASVAHLHVRDGMGAIVADTTVFSRTLDRIFHSRDVVINGSTGGESSLSREERCKALTDSRVEIASLNMGSTNFGEKVYVNTLEDIRYWAFRMAQARVVPELEVFAPGMIETARKLAADGLLDGRLHFNICLGFPGATPATVRHLAYFADLLRDDEWGFLHEGMTDLRLAAAALGHGARLLRVGFEDGGFLRGDRPARSNADLVENLVVLIRAAGCEPATVAEARELLGTRGAADERIPGHGCER